MRKNAYLTPATKVFKMESTAIMAASGEQDYISIDVDNDGTYEEEFRSKNNMSLWDEE